jgi:hypothetical protein
VFERDAGLFGDVSEDDLWLRAGLRGQEGKNQ